ncbi:hypothetical protein [Brevundimonas sp.]|jgi:hypothetical protein|uniref:hypothetical protein n=1 Tax=Brevundimonas sp. TaxID=1871086 RepID=UPI002E10FE24|nr:hypothetical protein [Brevundimonas sp.]
MGFFSRVVRQEIPSDFFPSVREGIDGAFASAHRLAVADGRVLPEQYAYARGTDRHYAVQKRVVDAGEAVGGEKLILRAGSSHYPMPLVRLGRMILATCITNSLDDLRRSNARAQLAKLNEELEPQQPSFWEEDEKRPLQGFRFGMLLIAKPHRDEDQSLPAGIYFGVPTSSLKAWHFYRSLDEVTALYEEADWAETPPVPERRIPQLRPRRKSEGSADEGTG